MICNKTRVIVLIGKKGRYEERLQGEYCLEDALHLMVEKHDTYLLRDTILHNKQLRDRLREVGAQRLIDELKPFAPESLKLTEYMNSFVEEFKTGNLADFDILYHPVDQPLTLYGQSIYFKGKHKKADIIMNDDGGNVTMCGGPSFDKPYYIGAIVKKHIGCYSDDYDDPGYTECTYIIRDHRIREKDLTAISDSHDVLDGFINSSSRLHERTSPAHLPMVYDDGRSNYLLVAVEH